jgi:hypothetical protein
VADVHMRAGGAGIADQADIGLRRTLRVGVRHIGDMCEGRHAALGSELAERGQLLHAGAGRIGVQDADADAALVEPGRDALEDVLLFGARGDLIHPARIAHRAPERFQRRFLVDPDHRADPGEGPVRGGAVVEDAALLRLPAIPGRDRQHAGLEVQCRGDPVEGLHAVGRNRLAMGMKVDEAGSHDQPLRVDHTLGAAEIGADRDDLSVRDRDIGDAIMAAFRIDDPATGDQQSAHLLLPLMSRLARDQRPRSTRCWPIGNCRDKRVAGEPPWRMTHVGLGLSAA